MFGNWLQDMNATAFEPILRRYAAYTEFPGIFNLALKRQARGLHAYGVKEIRNRRFSHLRWASHLQRVIRRLQTFLVSAEAERESGIFADKGNFATCWNLVIHAEAPIARIDQQAPHSFTFKIL